MWRARTTARAPPAKADTLAEAAQVATDPARASAATVYVGLGANLGDCEAVLRKAVWSMRQIPRTSVQKVSALYRSAPVEATGPDFLNAVAQLVTQLEPHTLLAALQTIEQGAGRVRPYRNAPRTLDLDILLYGERTLSTPLLTVPHPRLLQRAFALRPLAELAPHVVAPALLEAVSAQRVERLDSHHWVRSLADG